MFNATNNINFFSNIFGFYCYPFLPLIVILIFFFPTFLSCVFQKRSIQVFLITQQFVLFCIYLIRTEFSPHQLPIISFASSTWTTMLSRYLPTVLLYEVELLLNRLCCKCGIECFLVQTEFPTTSRPTRISSFDLHLSLCFWSLFGYITNPLFLVPLSGHNFSPPLHRHLLTITSHFVYKVFLVTKLNRSSLCLVLDAAQSSS